MTGYSKDDKVEIYISLWDFGGDTAEMEIAIFNIRSFLLRCWKRQLYLEGIPWLEKQNTVDYDINMDDCYDDLTISVYSYWW